jgi:histidyl-tRNA synthetase
MRGESLSDRVQIIKGFQDILPPRSRTLARFEDEARRVFGLYGYLEVRLPVLEKTELFARGIGPGTDIVDKEMYTFADRKERSLSLRPEGTASLVRAYLDAGKGRGEAVKWFYRGPMFRYERPQKGRYRQFNQIGAEAIGYEGPGTDAELIAMLDRLWQPNPATKWPGVSGVRLEINSLGCRQCRPAYRAALVKYLEGKRLDLCPDCVERLARNPLRVLDCKVPACQAAVAGAPSTLDHLCEGCKTHFAGVTADLDAVGIGYKINPRIVRGLDYYTRTVFEYLADEGLGSQNAIAAGGRYDNLVEEFGGPPTPAIGFAIGVERVALLVGDQPAPRPDYFIVAVGPEARAAGLKLLMSLRDRGLFAEMALDEPRSVKSQMKAAGKAGAAKVVVIGEEELKSGVLTVKDLETGEQGKCKAEEM